MYLCISWLLYIPKKLSNMYEIFLLVSVSFKELNGNWCKLIISKYFLQSIKHFKVTSHIFLKKIKKNEISEYCFQKNIYHIISLTQLLICICYLAKNKNICKSNNWKGNIVTSYLLKIFLIISSWKLCTCKMLRVCISIIWIKCMIKYLLWFTLSYLFIIELILLIMHA